MSGGRCAGIETALCRTGAVVVHHKSPETLRRAVDTLLSDGLMATHIVVVDNSSDGSNVGPLLPLDVRLLQVANDGYAAAANLGVRALASLAKPPEFVIVATHEVQAKSGSVRALVGALAADERLGYAGPTVVSGDLGTTPTYWSTGGYLTPGLRLPRHYDHKSTHIDVATEASRRLWFDGAFVAYRMVALLRLPFPEFYFLYMEEVDAQLQLTRAGYSGVWVPEAVISQTSSGVPNYYLTRNTMILAKRHGSSIRGLMGVVYETLRKLRTVRRVRDVKIVRDLMQGLLDGLRFREPQAVTPESGGAVTIINPLSGALAHYCRQFENNLKAAGLHVTTFSVPEPSQTGGRRYTWFVQYIRALLQARSHPGTIVSLWPVVGLFDLILLRSISGRRSTLIVHDPRPLVRAVGYGRTARLLAAAARIPVIVHTELAKGELSRRQGSNASVVPHPFKSHPTAGTVQKSGLPKVLVFGQYKPDRDLSLMRQIGQANTDRKVSLEVVGRGWPSISEWKVRSEFVAEDEIAQLLLSAAVVLIPYTRFYQSGVAIRAFELGVPVVGPESESLSALWGPITDYLVSPGSTAAGWWIAIERALAHGRDDLAGRSAAIESETVRAWGRWAASFGSK